MSKDRSEYFKEYKKKNKLLINEKQKDRRLKRGQEYKDLVKKNSKEYRDKNKFTPYFRWSHLKSSSNRRNIKIDLTFEEYSIIVNEPCHYCSNEFKINQECGGDLDRINNDFGYQINNVLPCCGKCNSIRGNFLTVEETAMAVTAIINYRNQGKL